MMIERRGERGERRGARKSAKIRNERKQAGVRGEIVVDDERNLLNIDSSSEQIGGDENSGRSRSELLHDDLSLSLFHISVHGYAGTSVEDRESM